MSRSTQTDVESSLSILWDREAALETAAVEEAEAEHQFKMAKARAYLAAEGTEKAREAKSLIDTEKLHEEYVKKQAVKEFTVAKWKDALQALSARQSILTASSRSDQSYSNDRRIT